MFNFSEEFINKLVNKDSEIFNKFYMESVDIFYRYLKGNYSISDGDAHDLISTLYLKVRNGLDTYRVNQNFSSWVWTIFRNLILDHYKLDRYTAFSELENLEEGISFEENIVSDENILENLETNYKYNEILTAIENLDEIYKEILHLKFVEDLSYDEISKMIGISNDNVRKRLSRAIKMLKDGLQIL